MRTLAVALAVCVACSAVAVAGEAVVVKEHPRLWVLKGDIPRIRERCRGVHKAEFEKIRAGAASYLTGTYQAAGPAWDVGDIVAYEANPYFTYAVGDASRSYDRKKLVEFKRAFLHVQPDWFVIYDRVVTTKPDLPVRWLLHSIDQPEVTGGTVSIINGEGRLDCRTLWPSEPGIEVIGGPGREFWVDGKNYPPKGKDSEQGAWRIEVTQDGTTRYEFLHALCATSSSVTEMDHMKVSLEESTFTVGFWESGRWVEVVFSRDWSPGDPVSGHITVRAAGTGFVLIDRDLIEKVTPEAGYVRWETGDDR